MTFPIDRIPAPVHRIVAALRPAEVHLVGGIVRDVAEALLDPAEPTVEDALAGALANDWDLTTNLRPEDVTARLESAGIRAVPTGIDHGTVTAVVDGGHYEITTWRLDVETDGRRAVVRFADTLEEDLARRDFTVNGLAVAPDDGRILDPFGGLDDLRHRMIRTIGPPAERFREDYLRMLRAVRFAVKIDGNIDIPTWEAMRELAPEIRRISAERIRDELLKMLSYPRPSRGFEILHDTGLLRQILPEFDACFGVQQNRYHADDVARHTLHVVEAIEPDEVLLRWTALMHDIEKPNAKTWLDEKNDFVFYGHEMTGAAVARRIMERLRFPREQIEKVGLLVREHMFALHPDISDSGIRRWMRRVGRDNIRDLLRLRIADRAGNRNKQGLEPGLREAIRKIRQVERSEDALDVTDLAIGGDDLIALGREPSPLFGEVLNALLEKVLDNPSLNTRETLLELARDEIRKREVPSA